jgi:hypothetical protein
MKRDRERESSWSWAAVILTVMVLLPVLYLISSGPIEWLMARGYVSYSNPLVKAFYFPGEFLMKVCPPLNDFVRWYLSLWK